MEQRCAVIETKTLLAMCYILDEYEEFKHAVEVLEKKGNNLDNIFQVCRLIQGKNMFISKESKKFYKEYKHVIDKINKYGYFYNFVMSNFCGSTESKISAEYCYQYLKANEQNLDTIVDVLTRLVSLEVNKIYFDTALDFTQKSYKLYTDRYYQLELHYLANMKNIPVYPKNTIEYITTTSPYDLVVRTEIGKIDKYGREIFLNTLIFDYKLLPEAIDQVNIYDEIISLKKNTEAERDVIIDSVDVSISLDDLTYMLEHIEKIISKLTNETAKERLRESADKIITEINKMKEVRDKFEVEALEAYPILSETKLTLEKKLYKERRRDAAIDTC